MTERFSSTPTARIARRIDLDPMRKSESPASDWPDTACVAGER